MTKKLAVFDFDSTLMDGETIEIIASELGLQEEVAKITSQAMEGKLDFFDSLTHRVSLLKGMKESRVDEICHNLPYMPGAKETITELKKRGYTVVCFSGGFKNATAYAKDILGYDAEFSNILHSKDGILTGLVGGPMMFSTSKGEMLQKLQATLGIGAKDTPRPRLRACSLLQATLGIGAKDTLVVGDGANDLSMFKYAKTRAAFCAKEILKKEATLVIDKKDLFQIIINLDK